MLARRDHSSDELRRKLLAKGYDAGIVAAVLQRLITDKLVDDSRYVQSFVASRAARGHGPLRVRTQLRSAGLQGALVEDALLAFPDWRAQAETARVKKFGAAQPANRVEQQRQARFLSYRGFTSAQIRTALGLRFTVDVDGE